MKLANTMGRTVAILTVLALGIIFGLGSASAQTETVLHEFTSTPDGQYPQASGLLRLGGVFYGVTVFGGANSKGAVYQITERNGAWQESVIYSFTGGNDGSIPIGSLIADSAGNLYGVTVNGGTANAGVVFEMSKSGGMWQESVLHSFGSGFDGANPQGPLVFGASGNLFGTTVLGGGRQSGTVYEMTNSNGSWTETVLHSFGGPGDGYLAYGGLTLDAAGNLYGTTSAGGANTCFGLGCGIVFELSFGASGWTEEILYNFKGGVDGLYPDPQPVIDANGNLYGATSAGGGTQCTAGIDVVGCGTVYKLSQVSGTWNETILHRFTQENGSKPSSPLMIDSKGNLYGETAQYNSNNGTVFRLSPKTTGGYAFKLLFTFDGTNGQNPEGGVIEGPGGILYGTTMYGGNDGGGVVFSLSQ